MKPMKFLYASLFCAWAFCAQAQIDHSVFIYETAPFPSCHASTIEETPVVATRTFQGSLEEMANFPNFRIHSSKTIILHPQCGVLKNQPN